MGKSISFSTFCLWLLMAGCAILNRHESSNKQPETRVTGTDSIVVGLRLTEEMRGFGYSIREQSDHSIVFEKQISDPKQVTRFGRHNNEDLRSRVSYKLFEQNGTVRVIADLKVITNQKSHPEHVTDASQHPDYTSIQEILQRVANHSEHQKKRDHLKTDDKTTYRQLKQDAISESSIK